jgi:hypothetical protein
MLFMYLKHVITAGILSAALAIGPGAAFAQTTGSTSGTSGSSSQGTTPSQGAGSQDTTSQGTSSQGSQPSTATSSQASDAARQGSGSAGADQEAVRQHLSAAREALAELTKLPAASQLQGDQRQQVAKLISDFNAFATATTDWRPKYDTIDTELDQILGLDGSAAASGSASGATPAPGASGSAGASTGTTADASAGTSTTSSGAVGTSGSGGAGALDPTIMAKLQEVRKHLDGFEEASGDPTFVVEKIEKILDQAAGGASASGTAGTSGSAASAGGSVTLTATQVQELRRQLDSIKAAAKR